MNMQKDFGGRLRKRICYKRKTDNNNNNEWSRRKENKKPFGEKREREKTDFVISKGRYLDGKQK